MKSTVAVLRVTADTILSDIDRLVELVRRSSGDDRNAAREHLVALFAAVGNDDPRVLKGRQALANALF